MGEQVLNPSGNAVQWQTKDRNSALAGTMRLTSDLALVNDEIYTDLLKHWVCDQKKLDLAFAASWKKLVESGGGWLPEADRRCELQSKATGQQTDPNKNTHSICGTQVASPTPASTVAPAAATTAPSTSTSNGSTQNALSDSVSISAVSLALIASIVVCIVSL